MKRIWKLALCCAITCLAFCVIACAPLPDQEDGDSASDALGDSSQAQSHDSASEGDMNCVIVYSQHANSKASPDKVDGYILGAKEATGYLGFVRLDGNPSSDGLFHEQTVNEYKNSTGIARENAQFVNERVDELEGIRAESPEVDIVKAVQTANDQLGEAEDDTLENVVVIVGAGLSTSGAIDLTSITLGDDDLDAYADWVVNESGQLTGLDHIDRIVWCGFDQIAEPQEAFTTEALEEELEGFYKKVFTNAGVGEVEFELADAGDDPDPSLPEVTTVPMPDPPKYGSGTQVTFETEDLGLEFEGDSDELVEGSDPGSNSNLQDIADSVKDGKLQVTIEGYTANNDNSKYKDNPAELRQMRADKVKEILINDFGCPAESITAKAGEGFIVDGTGDEADRQNRAVKFSFE